MKLAEAQFPEGLEDSTNETILHPWTLRSCAVDDMLRMIHIMIHCETLYYDHTKPLMLKFSSVFLIV